MKSNFNIAMGTYVLRDDVAECQNCVWKWSFDVGSKPSAGASRARRHVRQEGHTVIVRRVQFKEMWGTPK
jgi:hypothetical protein